MSEDGSIDGSELRDAPVLRAAEGIAKAFAEGDVDAFLSHLTEDVVYEPPAFVLGKRVLEGHEGVRQAFADLAETLGPDASMHAYPARYCIDRADPDKLLALTVITVTHSDGRQVRAEATAVMTARDGRIAEYRAWTDFDEARKRLTDPVEVAP